MAGSTFSKIASTSLSGSASSVTFSSLGSYTDILLISSYKCSSASTVTLTMNGDSGSNYIGTYLYGSGSTTTPYRTSSILITANSSVSNQTTDYIDFFNYRDTSAFKTVLFKHITPGTNINQGSGVWKSTSAITSFTLTSGSSFNAGSTFSIYGILKG